MILFDDEARHFLVTHKKKVDNYLVKNIFFLHVCSFESNPAYFILNSSGQQVLSGRLSGKKSTIDMGHLSRGLYLIQIVDIERQIFKLILK